MKVSGLEEPEQKGQQMPDPEKHQKKKRHETLHKSKAKECREINRKILLLTLEIQADSKVFGNGIGLPFSHF